MPIVAPAWSGSLMALLSAQGFTGSELFGLASSIGIGSAMSVTGKPFSTVDTGIIGGAPGAGIGVGLTVVAPLVTGAAFAQAAASFNGGGTALLGICTAVGLACTSQMAMALLTSVHPVITIGAGVVISPSIGVVGAAWGGAITAMGMANGMLGASWSALAMAIGNGSAMGVKASIGVVTITGGIISPIPLPGVGAGSGVIL